MGRLVQLWKLEESKDSVVYLYGPDREHTGRLLIDKQTGGITDKETVPGLTAFESWFLYGMLAKAKAEKMIKAHNFPEKASLAT